MTKSRFLVFQICILVLLLIFAAIVGGTAFSDIYTKRETQEFVLKRELNRAIVTGNYAAVEQMISEHPKLVNEPLAKNASEYAETVNDDTPLIAAGADIKLVRLLVDNGADINAVTPISHRYPLTSVLASGAEERIDVAWFYIGKGADLFAHDYVNGSLPYALLACEGIVQSNLQNSVVELMDYLYKKGVPFDMPELPSSEYYNLLGLAAENNYYGVIEYFAENKVYDFNMRITDDGKTALMIAAKHGNYGATNYLVYYGAREHFKDDYRRTAYDYAKISKDQRTIEYLS